MSDTSNDRRTPSYDEFSRRLGSIEATVVAATTRLQVVGERTHDHGNLLHVLDDKLEESGEVRKEILGNVNRLTDKVEVLNRELAVSSSNMFLHIQACDKRAARLEKFMWFLVSAMIAILGFFLAPHFGAR